jgi:GMP synthase (glutamine-hydrolysing)
MPVFRLLQARHADDPVRQEECVSFAARLGVPLEAVLPFDLLAGDCTAERAQEGVDAVLVGGSGKFSIYDAETWLVPFIDTLGALAEADVPMFASCFGFQGLVMALGGEVVNDEANAEVGTFELTLTDDAAADPLFGHLPRSFPAQLGHKDRATRLPEGAILLASSARCPYQALRYGQNVYATQFHPELDRDDNRFRFSRYLDDYAKVFGRDEAQHMLDSFQPTPDADGLLAGFLHLAWNR